MKRGEVIMAAASALAVAALVALAVPAVATLTPTRPVDAEPTLFPRIVRTEAGPAPAHAPSTPTPAPYTPTPEEQARIDAAALQEKNRQAMTTEQWAAVCPIIDRAWTALYMGDMDRATALAREAEAALGVSPVLHALHGMGGDEAVASRIGLEIDNGHCAIFVATPDCVAGVDGGPAERARGTVTARTGDGTPAEYRVAYEDSWERIAARFCLDVDDLVAANIDPADPDQVGSMSGLREHQRLRIPLDGA